MIKTSFIRICRRAILLLGLCVALSPGLAVAQQYYDPGILQKTIDRKPVDYQPPGTRLGSFMLNGGAELVYEDNDNIFYQQGSGESDSIFHVRPWANLHSDWNRHALNFEFFADVGRYSDFGDEDYEDWMANVNGRFDVKRGSAFNYKASYMQLHEDRSSPDDVGGIKPTGFSLGGFDLGYSHTFNRLTASVRFDRAEHDYDDNVDGDGGVIDNQWRDRSRDALELRLGYEYSDRSSVFASYAANKQDYDQVIDTHGYQRSSEGSDIRAGLAWNMTGVLNGDLYLQYVEQEYDDPDFSSVDGFGIGAGLVWTPTRLTNIAFQFSHTPQETTQRNASGYFSSLYAVRVQHELRRNWLLNARISYTDNDYEVVDDEVDSLTGTQVRRAGIGLGYLINRNLYLSGGYVYQEQSANSSVYEYETNRWFITFGAEF